MPEAKLQAHAARRWPDDSWYENCSTSTASRQFEHGFSAYWTAKNTTRQVRESFVAFFLSLMYFVAFFLSSRIWLPGIQFSPLWPRGWWIAIARFCYFLFASSENRYIVLEYSRDEMYGILSSLACRCGLPLRLRANCFSAVCRLQLCRHQTGQWG